MGSDASGFLSRWARRKEQARSGGEPDRPASEPQPDSAALVAAAPIDSPHQQTQCDVLEDPKERSIAEPPPTMADVTLLTRESDYARFMSSDVDEGVKRAAMKMLFSDPHFNVMDGLDTYIDDYGKPDPIPLSMLRQMNQSKVLRLFEEDEDDEDSKKNQEATREAGDQAGAQDDQPKSTALDDHPDMQLQPDHGAGQPGPDQGPGA